MKMVHLAVWLLAINQSVARISIQGGSASNMAGMNMANETIEQMNSNQVKIVQFIKPYYGETHP